MRHFQKGMLKNAIDYAVDKAPVEELWWIFKNLKNAIEFKPLDKRFEEKFSTNK